MTCLIVAFLWVSIETALMSKWGTSPGKWFLNVYVANSREQKLSITEIFLRSLDVWVRGMGIEFIYGVWVGWLFPYLDLKERGETRWDRAEGSRVLHENIGTYRAVGKCIILLSVTPLTSDISDLITKPSSAKIVSKILGCALDVDRVDRHKVLGSSGQ
jgi:hypothetical protein